ncbi:alpha/beta fold hydrolase [Streptomyces sp. NPDC001933]|uniref:alpha/beta fold hydrolase n=1 Tax=Streptomyces sp. NPDC001933 TaxID=3364626 RepID=UPI00368549B2
MTGAPSHPTFLLVHGAWHGAWCWERLTPMLHHRGWRTKVVDLPSAGGLTGMKEDARVIREALDAIDGPVIVVAHSYGGIPATQAVAGAENVARMVFLSAFQLDIGESLLDFYGMPTPSEPKDYEPIPDNPIAMFYGDLPRNDAEEAVKQLVPQSGRSFSDPLTAAGWHIVPSTYVICENDQALPAESQRRLAERSDTLHRLAADHSPFLSRPLELAALLEEIALASGT